MSSAMSSVQLMETATSHHPNYIITSIKPNPDSIHEVVFSIKPKNIESMTAILNDISNPASPNYGKHLSMEEVQEMTTNPEGTTIVKNYLITSGIEIINESPDGSFITAQAPISTLEAILSTRFSIFQNTQRSQETIIRTEQYFLPTEISKYVTSVKNTVQFPIKIRSPHILNTEE
jgi:tripeptidyl-peptidase-1